MIAKKQASPEETPYRRRLVTTGLLTTATLGTALIGPGWAVYFRGSEISPPPLAGLIVLTLATVAGCIVLRQVIVDLARREKAAARQAGRDLLSGLANRQLFQQWLDYEQARQKREQTQFALMILDIDHFKQINDHHGHDVGDRMIMAAARRISDTLRPSDRFARIGGDEFVILQTNVRSSRDVEALALRIVSAMREHFDLGTVELSSSVSIGIAMCPDNATEGEELLKLADLALYRAKKEGRNRHAFFDERMSADLARRRTFEIELAEAITQNALVLDYQPIFAMPGKRAVACEARLRWPHSERGMISARDFQSLAEERGLAAPLGEWLLRQACQHAVQWDVELIVNIGVTHFKMRDFAPQLLGILHETGLDPARLDIQLTEAHLAGGAEPLLQTMKWLRTEGVTFTLSQYGSGVTSLTDLRRFPFSRIRLDRTCLHAMQGATDQAAILHAATHFARALGLIVAADGVETQEQVQVLCAFGVQEMQGRMLCGHLPADEVMMVLATPDADTAGAA